MAMIDYGALLRVDGKFINKNADRFMEFSDTGYMCKEAEFENGEKYEVGGFVCAGDKNLLLTFYKGIVHIISNGKVIKLVWNIPFISKTFFLSNGEKIKISHLDKNLYEDQFSHKTWKEYVKENWTNATGDEKLSELVDGHKEYKKFIKRCRRKGKCKPYKYMTQRWIAEWEHNSHKYEVIFGYGIDQNEEVWNSIKKEHYEFTDVEREIIDKWFKEEKL